MKLQFLLEATLSEVTARFRTTPTMVNRARSNKGQVIVEMPPIEFLRLTTKDQSEIDTIIKRAEPLYKYNRWAKIGDNPKYGEFVSTNPEVRAKSIGREDREGERVHGNEIHPFLDINVMDVRSELVGKVRGHEGRHRAAALMQKGGPRFPVALYLRPGKGFEIPGLGKYERGYEEYYMNADHVPSLVIGQFNPAIRIVTSNWTVIKSMPLKQIPEQPDAA